MIGEASMLPDDNEQRIPLIAEEAFVTKAEVITDQLRVSTHVEERAVVVEEDLERGDLRVQRIPTDREVSVAPEPRQDGDTLIMFVVEERLVIEKRLFVTEEVRITRTTSSEHVSIPETVRVMRATVEHAAPTSSSTGSDGNG